ncbi:MAG: aspartyl/glutamyl-tRNA amidotransferase subunit B, aspartyl-tRNA(Asn)/glutamyl-tRNA (Gln) amidotransferase subunit B [Candidatus Wolfebacteria bacterium GW2011_GWC1_43_10]|uniref:Aspartyl/glutamyl-tRNA(Asn/Gln) amidotransferase subunit B n=1 Tax=Candidatus Wolfebacteria bacterium GW2011_GWC1_43_10 TaxID=1619011 RepID=A0A0G1CBD6_9BACT|nr:MAG: aspartyl/glutamyl-tRNA amidotransferase subunit B, aspartyl-tRNA(Asn)/glutamyl-tRNA (Gln) amidotransferase subunit B [Candidatus Wolfebacteria bacterium GW2011_GWC1_43_10]KKT22378.1 MAG: Aspartyl/glutamyl-tRNA(Asn/Gln) amidotransferase subunit B [Parcubacteria group bacterium GW2011_GWB1_43_8b]
MYKPTIGLEIHAELATRTKMFCDCPNDPLEIEPNVNVCPICLGHPGTLPKANQQAVEWVIKTGLALNCQISHFSKFDRKNYFYPDLPKAYQISQYDQPFCLNGFLNLPSSKKRIGIRRIHLEEDAAKLFHSADGKHSLVDFNRGGVPLMELVTEPDFSSAEEAVEFAQELQLILRYLGVSNADMERGNLRLEANISVAGEGEKLGTKVEIKNLNSFRSVLRAIKFETARQISVLEKGEKIIQETRGWDETEEETFSQRSKEEAHDYRYFPEPDLSPFQIDDGLIEEIKSKIEELPNQKRERFEREFNFSEEKSRVLIENRYLADFFEEAVSELRGMSDKVDIDLIYNYLVSDVRGLETDRDIPLWESKLKPIHLAESVYLIGGAISSAVAKKVLAQAFDSGSSPTEVVESEGLSQISDDREIEQIITSVIDNNQKIWYDYKNGKENALQFIIGQVMKETKGRANPVVVRQLLQKMIE